MKYLKDIKYIKYIILAIAIYLLFFYNIERFEIDKDIKNLEVCKNCKMKVPNFLFFY